jgi:hypothetical protein
MTGKCTSIFRSPKKIADGRWQKKLQMADCKLQIDVIDYCLTSAIGNLPSAILIPGFPFPSPGRL